MLRKCTKCSEEKSIERFVRQRGKYRTDPFRKDCKDCKNKLRREKSEALGKKPYRILKGNIPWNKGLPASPEVIEKLKKSHLGKSPPNKGMLKSEKRFSRKYAEWREKIRIRDEFKCKKCGSEKALHVHHIVPWKEREELRFDVENGIILCRSCHAKIEGYQKGHRQSEEIRIKLSNSLKGRKPWNKGFKKDGTTDSPE